MLALDFSDAAIALSAAAFGLAVVPIEGLTLIFRLDVGTLSLEPSLLLESLNDSEAHFPFVWLRPQDATADTRIFG